MTLEELRILSKEKNQDYKDGWNDAIKAANVAIEELECLRERKKKLESDIAYYRRRIHELETELFEAKKDPKQSIVDKIVGMLRGEGQIEDEDDDYDY